MDSLAVAHHRRPARCRAHPRFSARTPGFAVAAFSDVRARRGRHVAPPGRHPGLSALGFAPGAEKIEMTCLGWRRILFYGKLDLIWIRINACQSVHKKCPR